MHPRFSNAELIRTRDAPAIDAADVVVDVGGVYDPDRLRFDHHQKGFTETMGPGYATKLSSAGLVYKHFGKDLIRQALGGDDAKDATVEVVFRKIYADLIECVDAVDNGVEPYPASAGPPRYKYQGSSLAARVGRLNPSWTDADQGTDRRFEEAVAVCGEEFGAVLRSVVGSWLPAREVVEDALARRKEVHPSGEIIELSKSCPWKEHLLELEREQGVSPPIKYALYGEGAGTARTRVQCVPVRADGFENRLSLPADWRGLRDADLDRVSGIAGCVFVHAGGFIGGHTTREGALAMASRALASAATQPA